MNRPPVSVTIITLNEEANIGRAIRSAAWAEEVLVVDSGSVDQTVEIARSLGARVIHNPWPGYGKQKNFAQDRASHDWVLNIDADEEISAALAGEIRNRLSLVSTDDPRGQSDIAAFEMARKTYYRGRWIRHGGWYPNHLIRLADRRKARWSEPYLHEAWIAQGSVGRLSEALDHFSFESVADQVRTNLNFARLGAQELQRRGRTPSVTLLLLKPWGKFLETYFLKRGFLDGLPGLIISINAAYSMFLKFAFLWESTKLPSERS